jgi:hypothetical protein
VVLHVDSTKYDDTETQPTIDDRILTPSITSKPTETTAIDSYLIVFPSLVTPHTPFVLHGDKKFHNIHHHVQPTSS